MIHAGFIRGAATFCISAACLASNVSAVWAQELKPLVFGFSIEAIPQADLSDAKASMEVWLTKLLRAQKFELDLRYFEDNRSLIDTALRGEIDIFYLSSLEYARLRNHPTIEPLLVPFRSKSISEQYVIVAREHIALKQLNGKSILVEAGNRGELPRAWLQHLIYAEAATPPADFFRSIQKADKASQAILPTFFGSADACLVSLNAFEVASELNPQIKKQLQILATSPHFIEQVFCKRRSFSSMTQRSFFEEAKLFETDPTGAQVMSLLRFKGVAAYEPEMINAVVSLLDTWPSTDEVPDE